MPRPRSADPGIAALGALLGAAVSGGGGAVLGGIFGAAASQRPVPLDQALVTALNQRGLTFGSVRREFKNQIVVTFSTAPAVFWSIVAQVHPGPTWTADQLDDALYDEAVRQLDEWRQLHAGR